MQAVRPDLARTTYLEAVAGAMSAGRLQPAGRSAEIAEAALMAPPTSRPTASDRLLDGLATRLTRGRQESRKPLADALEAFRATDLSDRDAPWVGLAGRVAADLWDDEEWDAFSRRAVQYAKDAGTVADLSTALDRHAVAEVQFGGFSVAS